MGNEELKKALAGRAAKVRSGKVKAYVKKGLMAKVDQAGDAAGAWVEDLESHFDRLKPEGMMKGFSGSDFSDLYFVLTGRKRKDRHADLAERVADAVMRALGA